MRLSETEEQELTQLAGKFGEAVPPASPPPNPAEELRGPTAQDDPLPSPEQAPEEAPTEPRSLLQKTGDVIRGVAAGAIRAPAAAAGGTLDLATDVGQGLGGLAAEGISALDDQFFDNQIVPALATQFQTNNTLRTAKSLGDFLLNSGDSDDDGFTEFSKSLSGSHTAIATAGNDLANSLTTEVGSVVLGFGAIRSAVTRSGLTKGLRNSKTLAIAENAVLGGVAAQVIDPDQERLSNVLINVGVDDPTGFLDALAQEPDEARLEARLALFAEDAILSSAIDSVFRIGRYAWHSTRTKPDPAKLKELEAELVDSLPSNSPEVPVATDRPAQATSPTDPLSVSSVAETVSPEGLVTPPSGAEIIDNLREFAKRNNTDLDINDLTSSEGKIVVPDNVVDALNTAARAEGSTRDVFTGTTNRSIDLSPTTSVKEGFLNSIGRSTDEAVETTGAAFRFGNSQGVFEVLQRVSDSLPPTASDTFDPSLPPSTANSPSPTPRPDAEVLEKSAAFADRLGVDINTGRAFIDDLARRTGDLDKEIKAAQIFTERAYKDIDNIDLATIAEASDDVLQDYFQRVHNAYLIGESYTKIGTGLGRGLRARRGLTSEDYISSVNNPQRALELDRGVAIGNTDIPGLPYSRESLVKWLQDFQTTAGNPKARASFLKDASTIPSAGRFVTDSLVNTFTSSILSGLYTFTTNVVAPVIIAPTRTAAKAFGGVSRAALLQAQGNPQAARQALQRGEGAVRAHAMAAVQASQLVGELTTRLLTGGRLGLVDATSSAGRASSGIREATRRGNSVLRSGNFIDVLDETRVDVAGLGDDVGRISRGGYHLGNVLNIFPRAFRRLNAGVDELANRVSYTGEAAYQLFAQASEQGLTGRDAVQFVEQKLPGILDANNAATSPTALRESQRTTLTGRPGTPGESSERLIQAVNSARASNPLFRTILPVFNVPVNGVGELLRGIPGSNILLKELRGDLSGARGSAIQEEAYGRWLIGTGIMTLGYNFANQGLLTGSGPSDPRARRRWLESGYKPYSIRTAKGNEWIDYTRFDQIGGLLGLVASFNDVTVATNNADRHRNALLQGAGTLAAYFRDKGALQGFSRILSADDSGPNSRNLERSLRSFASSVAIPNFINATFTNTADPIARRRDTLGQDIQARIPPIVSEVFNTPISSDHLDPILNSLGEPIYKRRNDIHENIFPYLHDTAGTGDDIVFGELEAIYMATGSSPGIVLDADVTGGRFRASEVRIDDTGEEGGWNIVSEFVHARGTVKDPTTGLNLREALEQLITSPEYQDDTQFVYQSGSRTKDSSGRASRNAAVSKLFRQYRSLARADLARRSEKAARAFAITKIQRGGGIALREVKSLDVIDDPSILAPINIGDRNALEIFEEEVLRLRPRTEETE